MKNLYILLIIGSLLILTGCGPNVKPTTEVVYVQQPVLYCPAPNTEALDRPTVLAIQEITPDMSDGEVVQRYYATIRQLTGYIARLEKTLDKYNTTSAAYQTLREEFSNEVMKNKE